MPPIDIDFLDGMLPDEMRDAGEPGYKGDHKAKSRQSLTVLLPKEIKDLIDGESRRTGETTASIIERAILNLFRSYSYR